MHRNNFKYTSLHTSDNDIILQLVLNFISLLTDVVT